MARKMKDSGVAWIGDIPEGWEVSELKYTIQWKSEKGRPDAQVLSLYRDYGIVPKDSRDDNHNVTSLDTSNYKVVDIGDLVINKMKAWQGSMAVSDYQGIVSPAYHVCRITSNKVDKRYLHHLLRNPAYLPEYTRLSTGMRIGQWDLGFDDFKNIPFLIPPLDEQKRIAHYLDSNCSRIDAILAKTRTSIEEYKKLKQAVITQAVTKGVRGEREMKESGVEWIGEIPREWQIAPMKHFIDILPGYAFSSNDFSSEDGIPLLRGINVGVNEIRWDETVRLNHPISKQIDSFSLKVNDLVVGLDRPWISDGTRVAFISEKDLPCLLLQRVCRIRIRCDSDIRWIYYWLSGNGFKESLTTETTGISVPHISTKQIEQFSIPFPKQSEQSQICDYLDAKCAEIDRLIAKKEQLVKELEGYKKSLIYEVVTGKREV